MTHPVLAIEPCRHAPEAVAQCRPIDRKIVRVHDLVPIIRAEATSLEPEELDEPRRGGKRIALDIPFIDAFGHGLTDEPVAFLEPGIGGRSLRHRRNGRACLGDYTRTSSAHPLNPLGVA